MRDRNYVRWENEKSLVMLLALSRLNRNRIDDE